MVQLQAMSPKAVLPDACPSTHVNAPWAPEATLPFLSSAVQAQPHLTSAPLWGRLRPLRPAPEFLAEPATCTFLCFLGRAHCCPETPWNSMGFTGQDPLTSFRDPNVLFIIVKKSQSPKSIWDVFFIFLSQGIYFVSHAPPHPQSVSGEGANTWDPSCCPFLHLCRGKDQHWADLPGPARREACAGPHAPAGLPSVATAACPPRPLACSFSQ